LFLFIGAQPPAKDKSAWRKSNLNTSDGVNIEEDARKLRRLRSRSSMEQITLRPVPEEDKRKGIISALSQDTAEDKLTLYLRRPSGEEVPLVRGGSLRIPRRTPEPQILPPSMPRRLQRQDEAISDKIEIDSDNIETPPTTRRKFTKLRDLSSSVDDEPRPSPDLKLLEMQRTSPEGRSDKETFERGPLLRNSQRLREIAMRGDQDEVLGDGQFDRFSSARRTRRYKKSQEVDASEEKENSGVPEVMTPELISETQVLVAPKMQAQSVPINESGADKDARLKAWQDRLKYHGTPIQNDATRVAQEAITDINKVGSELKNIDSTSRASSKITPPRLLTQTSRRDNIPKKDDCVRKDRARSNIDSKQVSEALKSRQTSRLVPTAKTPAVRKSDFIPEIRIRTSAPGVGKHRTEHELNDEGFEETQSLVSESLSQNTSSGNLDSLESPLANNESERKRGGKLDRADSSGSGDTNTSSTTNPPPKKLVRSSAVGTRLDRSSSVRVNPSTLNSESKRIPLFRTSSLRKTDSQSSVGSNKTISNLKRRGVERSNSKTSLRSSRSSLNSSTSVNTVKNVPSSTKQSPSNSQQRINVQRLAGYTTAIKNLTNNLDKDSSLKRQSSLEPKRPLSSLQPKNVVEKPRGGSGGVPASRSSSSGSSIGPSARRPRLTPGLSASFKENVARVKLPISTNANKAGKTVVTIKYKENDAVKSNLNFMKPTAASTAKDMEIPPVKLRSVPKRFLK